MKKPAVYLITVIIFLLGSCASISDLSISSKIEEPQKISSGNSDYLIINSPYTLESLLVPVVQMNNLAMSLDYFNQFIEYGDYIFPDYLFRFIGMEASNYLVGEGSVLYSYQENNTPLSSYKKALLSRDVDGNSWWQLQITFYDVELFLEVLVNKYDIPQKIRFINNETGIQYEIVPDIAVSFEEALSEMPLDELELSVKNRIDQAFEEDFVNIITNPIIVGEELVETPAGRFKSVHIKDLRSDTTWVNYWLSPDVPGGIVRTSFTADGSSETAITELIKLQVSAQSIFQTKALVLPGTGNDYNEIPKNMEPGYSEGSSDYPILLFPDEIYYGSVGDGETSYYKINVDRRSDIIIEFQNLAGLAELLYYGEDSSFENWSTGSEGAYALNLEGYMIDSETCIYFSLNDIPDEYSIGEHFSINIYQNYILNSTGIMMKGDIYNNAEELVSGKIHNLSVSSEGLDYYKSTVKKGSSLEITVLNEPEYGSLIWFDTQNGSYSSMYSDWGSGYKTIIINGLKPGTECYYYFSSDTELYDPLQNLELRIIEKP